MTSRPDSDTPPSDGPLGRWLVVAALVLAFVPLLVFPVSDTDTWWHLATGKHIVETRGIPKTDVFSSTVAGQPWVTHEWLFQVAAWGAYSAAGLPGLTLAKAAIVLAAFLVLLGFARDRGVPVAPAALLILAAAWLGADRFSERPQVASYLLFAVFLRTLFDRRDLRRDRTMWLPPLVALWANLHSGFVFGLGLVGVFFLDAVIRRAGVRRMGAILGLCVGAALLNPNGVHSLLYPLEILRNPLYKTVTAEYQPIRFADLGAYTHVAVYYALVVLGALAAVAGRVAKGRWAPLPVFLFALFAAAALMANRNRVLFALAAVPLLVEPFAALPRPAGRAWRSVANLARGPALRGAAVVLLLAFAGLGSARGVRISEGFHRPVGLGVAPGAPVATADLIRRAELQGNFFNEMRFGGYLIWALSPERRVFIDGRQLLYGEEIFRDYVRVLSHESDFSPLVERHGIEYFILRNPAVPWNPAGFDPFPPLAQALASEPGWACVHFDDVAVVYVRRGSGNEAVIRDLELSAIDPLSGTRLASGVDPVADRERILAEVRRLRTGDADPFARIVAATAAARVGDPGTALSLFAPLLEQPAGEPSRRLALRELHEAGRALLQGGQAAEAMGLLEALVAADRRSVSALNDLGVAHAGTGDLEGARELWERSLTIDPANAGARDNLQRLRSRSE